MTGKEKSIVKILFLSIFLLGVNVCAIAQQSYIDSMTTIIAGTTNPDELTKEYSKLANHLSRTDLKLAIDYNYKALEVAKDNKLESKIGQILHRRSAYYFRMGEIKKATVAVNKSMAYNLKNNDSIYLAGNYINLAAIYYYQNILDSAKIFFQKGADLKNAIDDSKGEAIALTNLAIIYANEGELFDAINTLKRAYNVSSGLDDYPSMIAQLSNLGTFYLQIGDKKNGLKSLTDALNIARTKKIKVSEGNVLLALGNVYEEDDKELGKALNYYVQSAEVMKESGHMQDYAASLYHIGQIYLFQSKFAESKKTLLQALKVIREQDTDRHEAKVYISLGMLYNQLNLPDSSDIMLNKGLDILRQKDNKLELFPNLIEHSKLLETQKRYTQERKVLIEALEIAKETQSQKNISISSKLLAENYNHNKEFQDAYGYLHKHIMLEDSLSEINEIKEVQEVEARLKIAEFEYKNEKLEEINQLQKKNLSIKNYLLIALGFIAVLIFVTLLVYIYQKKRILFYNKTLKERNDLIQEQSEKLSKQNILLNKNNSQLKELNQTKDKFFSIIAHDLKSPFNAMLGFSNLLIESYAEYDDDEKHVIFKSLNKCSEDAFRLVENLLTWSRSQTGIMTYLPEKLDLRTVVLETTDLLQAQANTKSIQVFNTIQEDDWVFADKNMLSTIFRNLISNAIKFTPKEGEVMIKANKIAGENNQMITEISVKDTGIGISKEIQSKLFDITANLSTKGTENETGTGIGLVLCKEFVEKHQGEIFVESEIGKGSKFIFRIPSP